MGWIGYWWIHIMDHQGLKDQKSSYDGLLLSQILGYWIMLQKYDW